LLVTAALIPAGLVLASNLVLAGYWAGGYGIDARDANYGVTGAGAFFRNDLLVGLAGLLFSPSRGLFAFSISLQLLLYAKADWMHDASWGPQC
jgi:hypothetical protein